MAPTALAQLGLGHLGAACANCFIGAGLAVTLWNRSAGKTHAFQGRAAIAPNAGDACASSALIVVCLSDYAAALEVLDQAAASTALAGKTLLQLTSGTPSDARTLEAWARMHGMRYLDVAIIAYPALVGTPQALVHVAGEEEDFAAQRAILALLGGNLRHVGEDIGNAQALNCALLDYYYGATLAMLHGAALSDSENLPLTEYFFNIKAIAPLLNATADTAREMIRKERYSGEPRTLDGHLGALRHIQRMSHDNEVDPRVPDTLVAAYRKARSAGYGEDEIAAVFETLRRG